MLAEDALVSAGRGDNIMGASGTGNIRAGVVTVSLGTFGMICAFSGPPVVDSKGEIAGFCDGAKHWLPLSCAMNVALITEPMRELFRRGHPDDGRSASTANPI
jgi:xylulokinase